MKRPLVLIGALFIALAIYAQDIDLLITVPDQHKSRVLNAYLSQYPKLQAETYKEYGERVTKLLIKDFVLEYEERIETERYSVEVSTTIENIKRNTINIPEDLLQ